VKTPRSLVIPDGVFWTVSKSLGAHTLHGRRRPTPRTDGRTENGITDQRQAQPSVRQTFSNGESQEYSRFGKSYTAPQIRSLWVFWVPREYRYWLYDYEHPDTASILLHLESILHQNPKIKLNLLIVAAKVDLKDLFEKWQPEGYEASVKGTSEIFRMRLRKVTPETEEETLAGDILAFRFANPVYVFLSDQLTQFVKHVLHPFLDCYYPDVLPLYLSSYELFLMLRGLKDRSKGDVVIDRLTAYSRLEGPGERRRIEVTYTHETLEDVFHRVLENDQWVDKIRFSLFDPAGSLEMSGYLSRYGFFRCRHSFALFFQSVVTEAMLMAGKKLRAFGEKNRSIERPSPRRLEISYDTEVFQGREQILRFSEAMTAMKFTSTSIYHGNPYFHASMLDYLDGSSYEIWVVTGNKVHIIPQIRASDASLARLVNHIFEFFKEGSIEGYANPTETLSH